MKRPTVLFFPKAKNVPNSSLPVLIYRSALALKAKDKEKQLKESFKKNGWVGVWTDTIYDYTHFHSNAHEVLGIAEGRVTLHLGGSTGQSFHLRAGDIIVLPAGTGHRRVGRDKGLKVIGAYPRGQAHFNIKRRGIITSKAALPKSDPFLGEKGPLLKLWPYKSTISR
jgi:uncharacterized protein YjlB